MSARVWKMLHNGMSTDDNVSKLHIACVSKCSCCEEHQQETLNHLILHSKLAKIVWEKFSREFQINVNRTDIQHFLKIWIHGANLKSQFGYTRVVTCITICYFLWEHRNEVRHNERKLNPEQLIDRIKNKVKSILSMFQPGLKDSIAEEIWLETAGHRIKQMPVKRGNWIRWQPPKQGLKLNFDGSFSSSKMSAGGVFRDNTGEVIFAYANSTQHREGSPNMAEATTLEMGLNIAKMLNLPVTEIEGDALQLIQAILNNESDWKIHDIIQNCRKLIGQKTLRYIPRQINEVADALSKQKEKQFNNQLQKKAKHAWQMDRMGLFSFKA